MTLSCMSGQGPPSALRLLGRRDHESPTRPTSRSSSPSASPRAPAAGGARRARGPGIPRCARAAWAGRPAAPRACGGDHGCRDPRRGRMPWPRGRWSCAPAASWQPVWRPERWATPGFHVASGGSRAASRGQGGSGHRGPVRGARPRRATRCSGRPARGPAAASSSAERRTGPCASRSACSTAHAPAGRCRATPGHAAAGRRARDGPPRPTRRGPRPGTPRSAAPRLTDERPELHDRDVPGGRRPVVVGDEGCRQRGLGRGERRGRVLTPLDDPGQHAPDVGVDDGGAAAEANATTAAAV